MLNYHNFNRFTLINMVPLNTQYHTIQYHLSWVFYWWSSLAVAFNFAENRTQGAWRLSACSARSDVPAFIFM